MQNVAPAINQTHRGGTLRLAFLSAVVSLVVSFAAAAAPIALYNIYRAEDGFTNFGISMAIVTYSVGTMAGLLVLGRLSDHLGRRLTAIASLGLLLLGCLLLLNVHDIGTLLAGRVLMGVGTGLASSTLTSYIVDAAPARQEWLASVASSQRPTLGLTVGAIASGALVQFGLWPRDLIYLVCVGFLSVSAVLIAISPETTTPTPAAWRSLLPRVSVPARVRHLLPVAAAVFPATGATGAFYQAFVPALVEDQLHTRSPLILGLVFGASMAPSVLGAPIGGRFTSAVAQRVGMITFLAGMIGIITAINAGTLALFIIATIVAGAGQGIAISGATRELLHGSTLADRAPIFSAIYLVCYSGATFPSLISGKLSNTFSLPQIAFGYGVLPSAPPCSLSSVHAIRTLMRPGTAPAAALRPSTMPPPPSTRPNDARGSRASVFVREDSGRASGSPFLVDHRCLLDRGDRLGTHPGGRFIHVLAQFGPLI
jgi:MFS family permease